MSRMSSIGTHDIPTGIIAQEGICSQELDYSLGRRYALRMSDTTLARNIAALRRHLGMTQADFAKEVGSAQANVSKWEKGGIQPDAIPMGEMARLAGTSVKDFTAKPWEPQGNVKNMRPVTLEDLAAEHGWVLIDEIDLSLGMGATYLDANNAPERIGIIPFAVDWIRDMHRGPISHLKVVRGRGDSMEPTIRDGDFVLVDTSRRRLDEQDVVWAVSYGDLGMIRRLRQMPSGGVMLMPDNSVVRPTEAFDGEMAIMGRVIWIGRRM